MSANKIPARPMEYPYTMAAKFTHFPYKMYFNHANWRYKWSVIGYGLSIPFFIFLNNALNSPGNQEKRKEFERKIHKDHEEHLKHLK
ncbi:uncharacterized protein LOC117640736 [Thrips palmi]|uniref:Uncharacterized protein LOC117640736 n=1 Tax=Thrips palmi TaxID=161013 RepID=A0A6P8Y9T5_THRPL|nr:uncharacterized protein LOC117640736 [Thrips palmi]XP_034233476.1 uncharacterized protein LOC117640736 [Thrips palmi]